MTEIQGKVLEETGRMISEEKASYTQRECPECGKKLKKTKNVTNQ